MKAVGFRSGFCRASTVTAIVGIVIISMMIGACRATDDANDSIVDNARKWTIGMYWASDNNLDEYTEYFIQLWMDYLTNRDDVALCVFIDRLTMPANLSTLTETGWVEIESYEEINSSSPATLSSFIQYALTEPSLSSDNFMLMVQDHGNGYLGLCSDECLPGSDLPKVWMSIDNLGEGIRDALDKTEKSIDVISLDACTLGTVEIAYELRGTASYLVASQLGVPFDGQNYIDLLSGLSTDPDIEPLDLVCKLVDDYEVWYSAPLHTLPTLYPYMQDFASLSVIDLNALGPLIDAFNDFREAVIPKDNSLGKYLKTASLQSDVSLWMNNMGTWFYPDIKVMFTILGESTAESYPEVSESCGAIVAAASNVIVHDWASWRMRGLVTGLSVFVCPSIGIYEVNWDSFERAYDNVELDFVDDTGWDIVLQAYFFNLKQYGDPLG